MTLVTLRDLLDMARLQQYNPSEVVLAVENDDTFPSPVVFAQFHVETGKQDHLRLLGKFPVLKLKADRVPTR